MTERNRRVVLASRPEGWVKADNFRLETVPLPEPREGEVLVKNHYLSLDPYMRGRMDDAKSYAAPQPLDEVMVGETVGEVVASKSPKFAPGDMVVGRLGWQEYAAADPSVVRKVDATRVPLSAYLGVVGMPGMTAWYGFHKILAPKAGETVVVSAAAGAVGGVVGQLAKLAGCRAVGIAGGPEKVRLCLEEFGYDAAIDYKAPSGGDLSAAVAGACPEGVHVYFDNTAGPVSDAVLPHLAVGGRVVVCGTASVASWDPPPLGPRVERHLLVKRARMQGFLYFDHLARAEEAVGRLAGWLREGKLRHREDVLEGLDQAPGAIAGLYRGENLGKRLIRVGPG